MVEVILQQSGCFQAAPPESGVFSNILNRLVILLEKDAPAWLER